MWWLEIEGLAAQLSGRLGQDSEIDPQATIEDGCVLDTSAGPIHIGPGTRVCSGAIIRGPAAVGADCMIGNQALIRGPVILGTSVKVGFATEIKQALIGDDVAIGPMCFVSDTIIEDGAYLGAMVRTSNQRLDRKAISVHEDGRLVETGCLKLGCRIGSGASLGIQVIVLPGRVIAPQTTFEPRITVNRNYPAGHYRIQQAIEQVKAI